MAGIGQLHTLGNLRGPIPWRFTDFISYNFYEIWKAAI